MGSPAMGVAPWEARLRGLEPELRSLLRRHAVPSVRGTRRAPEEAFRAVLSEANRELALLLRDVRAWHAGVRAGAPPQRSMDDLLARAIRCAVQQYTLQAEMGALALRDELTGMCNRRGFLMLAERQLKLGRRAGRPMLLFFVDIDRLKAINDGFGHQEGDRALVRTAQAMERTFRDSDLLARFGGDEFAALAIEASGNGKEAIIGRLRQSLEAVTPRGCRYRLSVSCGVAKFDPASRVTIGQLMVLADQDMFRTRRSDFASREEGAEPGRAAARADLEGGPEPADPGMV